MNPGVALPYSKVRYVRLLIPLFLLTPRPIAPKKFVLSPPLQDPMCFEVLIKSYKFITQ